MAMVEARYRQALRSAYEAEVANEAWFLAMAESLGGGRPRECLALLAEVERRAAGVLEPILQRLGLEAAARADLYRRGREEAASSELGDWPTLLRHLRDDYPKYIAEYRELARQAPAEHRPAWAALAQHEVVTVEFARRELAGDADATAPLHGYLQAGGEVAAT